MLLVPLLSGCGFEMLPEAVRECIPREMASIASPDDLHVIQRWESICGFAGSTVTDIFTVTDKPVASPPWGDTIVFDEGTSVHDVRDQISASWIDSGHIAVVIDAFGDVRGSPREIAGIAIRYVLGPSIDPAEIDRRIQTAIDERRELERLKKSSSWSYVENEYNFDAYKIEHYRKIKNGSATT